MTKNRELTGNLIDLIENLLDAKDITIPSDDREGDESEARIYGMEYAFLLDGFEAILCDNYPQGAVDEGEESGADGSDQSNVPNNREIAEEMLSLFEDLLTEKDITIPSINRIGAEGEARLYGGEFWRLLGEFEDMLDGVYPQGTVDEDGEHISGEKDSQKILKDSFLESEISEPMYGIFQLKKEDRLRPYRFTPLSELKQSGMNVEYDNYNLVYADFYKGEGLDDIYGKFNLDHPADFIGHSLSVSDIIVVKEKDAYIAHYVDSFGFKKIPYFIEQMSIDSEPVVIIKWSEHERFEDGQRIPLSDANNLFFELDNNQRIDREKPDHQGSWYYKTSFEIKYIQNGEANKYEGRQDFGDGDGSIISHIREFAECSLNKQQIQEYYAAKGPDELREHNEGWRDILNNFIPYMMLHCRFSELDKIVSGIPENMWVKGREYTDIVKRYIADCRTVLNTQDEIVFPDFPKPERGVLLEETYRAIMDCDKDIRLLPRPVRQSVGSGEADDEPEIGDSEM